MIDSRQKGATAETKARDELRRLTGLKWERVPGSGALDPKHQLKGDLYVIQEKNLYCVEVKHYKDDQVSTALFTGKSPTLFEWWNQCTRQAKQVDKKPLLIFKHDRSKFFVAYDTPVPGCNAMKIYVDKVHFNISLLTDWVAAEIPEFIA